MIFKIASKQFIPPPIEEFIKEQYWTINEAVHVLVGWPKEINLFPVTLSLSERDIILQRTIFYLPCPDSPFDPKTFGKRFNEVFMQMKKSIEKGALEAKFGCSSDSVTCLISPEKIILWALNKGLSLPNDLQRATNVHQIGNQKTSEPKRTKVQRKIASQFILYRQPDANSSDICKDHLLKQLLALDKTVDKELKAIKRAAGKVFTEQLKRGRPSQKNRQNGSYLPKEIPEVMQRDPDGIIRYHFPHLRIALETAMRAKILMYDDEDLRRMSLKVIFLEFLQDPIVKLYLPEPSDLVLEFAQQICNNIIGTYFLQLPSLLETIEQAIDKGVEFDWPLRWPLKESKIELMRATGIKCLF